MEEIENDFVFFQQVVSHISGSLDLSQSMVRVFAFLKEHFPIEGISLHQYSTRLNALKLLFLVTEDAFNYVETTLPLSKKNADQMIRHENSEDPVMVSDDASDNIVEKHRQAISHFLSYQPSSYMVGIMKAGGEVIGHLCFIASGDLDYTPAHVRKFRLLLDPFSLAMSNMLQFKRVLEFQEKLNQSKIDLEKTLHQLQDASIIGARNGLRPTMNIVRQLEGKETPVLILGESGTGKELIADAVQNSSPRSDKPFIKVNCGAIPDTLVDSELFGYEKGAFTGAGQSRPGRFEQAHGGTLFLDEVGELPLQAQVRLLRVLQNKVVERIGGKKSIPVDVRIIAATNRNLKAMLKEGSFREDLYYRLYVYPVQVPPLRDRSQDIPALIHHFIKRSCARFKISPVPVLHPDSMDAIKTYPWPGNVRELENTVERGVILCSGDSLRIDHFLTVHQENPGEKGNAMDAVEALIDKKIQIALEKYDKNGAEKENANDEDKEPFIGNSKIQGIRPMETIIRHGIETALAHARGRIHGPGGAAELLELNPSTLRSKMRKMRINPDLWR